MKLIEPALKIQTVLDAVCTYYNIDEKTLLSKTRKKEIIEKRQQFHYFAYKFTDATQDKVGKYKSEFDHATVIHSIRTVENLRFTEKLYNATLTAIEQKLMLQNYLASNSSTTMTGEFAKFTNDLDVVYTIVN